MSSSEKKAINPAEGIYQFEARFDPYHGLDKLHISSGLSRIEFLDESEEYSVSLITIVNRSGEDEDLTAACLEGKLDSKGKVKEGDVLKMKYNERIGLSPFSSPSEPSGLNVYTVTEVRGEEFVRYIGLNFESERTEGKLTFTRSEDLE